MNGLRRFIVVFGAILTLTPGLLRANAMQTAKGNVAWTYWTTSFPNRHQGFVYARSNAGTGALLTTGNDGKTWTRRSIPVIPLQSGGMQFVDANHGWAWGEIHLCIRGCWERVYATDNGGKTWKRVLLFKQHDQLRQVQFAGVNRGWVSYDACRSVNGLGFCANRILKTTDGGGHWQSVSWPEAVQRDLMRFNIGANGFGWASTSLDDGVDSLFGCRAYLFLTTDYGRTWTQRYIEQTRSQCGLFPAFAGARWGIMVESNECAMGGCGLNILRTANGGKSWKLLPESSLHGLTHYLGFVDSVQSPARRNVWVTFSGGAGPGAGGVGISNDAGRNWHRYFPCYRDLDSNSVALTGPREGWIAGGDVSLCNVRKPPPDLVHTTDGGKSWQSVSTGL